MMNDTGTFGMNQYKIDEISPVLDPNPLEKRLIGNFFCDEGRIRRCLHHGRRDIICRFGWMYPSYTRHLQHLKSHMGCISVFLNSSTGGRRA